MPHKDVHWLRKGWRLYTRNPHHIALLLRLTVWTIMLCALAKRWPIPQVLRFMTTSHRALTAVPPACELVAMVDRLLSLNYWVFTPTCWKRAILLHRGLALQGIHTQIVFGVRKSEGDLLEGHAWLEAQGEPLYEARPPDYVRTLVFP